MADVLEEVTNEEIDRGHVIKRVDDWVDRIERLYDQIEAWLPEGWTADRKTKVSMHEELMQKFGIESRDLSVLQLSYRGGAAARIEPRGLWIVGVNGRLDFFRGDSHYLIIDNAANFAPPDWHIAPIESRRNLQRLTRETFTAVL